MRDWEQITEGLCTGDIRSLARAITLVENNAPGYLSFLKNLKVKNIPVIGITGPPGAGKSTLTDALLKQFANEGKKTAVLCVDPSSPFNFGAILGDRIRMAQWYVHPNVFIRSLASRGSLGGLSPKIIEITDVAKAAQFDYIIVETVGVGQSEVEVAALADLCIVVLVPESGDEVQTMKAGLMEIADIFVVNKADRPGTDTFVKNLQLMLMPKTRSGTPRAPVIKTVASQQTGLEDLHQAILHQLRSAAPNDKKYKLLAEKAYQLIQQKRMAGVNKKSLEGEIRSACAQDGFNIYRWTENR